MNKETPLGERAISGRGWASKRGILKYTFVKF
jgi:hypothetical protein